MKGLQVLLDRIDYIAVKVESLEKEVQSMKEVKPPPEMNLQNTSWLPSDPEIREWLNMPIPSPERSSSVDLLCSETPFPSNNQWIDQTFPSSGSGARQEWANQD